jgi:DUF4097 and DUF4098 domain-containing protein YvlB
MRLIAFIGLALILTGAALADYNETRTMELAADGIDKLKIDCGAGFLEVEGLEETGTILVEAEIVIENMSPSRGEEYVEENLVLSLEKRGHYAELESRFEGSKSILGSIFSHGSRLINLTVKVPKNMALSIDDGSGLISIRNIAGDVNMDDGSGEIEIVDITGDVEVDDGSGGISIVNVTGNVEISDGSGEIDIKRIDGDVVVRDGSGDILINGVTQDVDIADDGSGDCRIRNVDGRVYQP